MPKKVTLLIILLFLILSAHTAGAQIRMQPFYPTATPTPIGGIPPTNTPPAGPTNTPAPGGATATLAPTRAPRNTVECLVNSVSEESIKIYVEHLTDNDTTPQKDENQTRYSRSLGNITEAAYVRGNFTANGLTTTLQPFEENCPTGNVTSGNNIGVLQGTTIPNEIYLITSHMDSIAPNPLGAAPGADNAGSGTALVMEAARVFRACGFTPKRSIELIAFSGGEEGQLGSTFYVRDYVQNRRATKTIKGVFNVDMIGTSREGAHVVFSYNSARPGQPLADKVAAMKTKYNIPLTIDVSSSSQNASDHTPFLNQNIPAVYGHEYTRSRVYNTSEDKPSNPDYSYSQIALTTKAVVAAIAELANE